MRKEELLNLPHLHKTINSCIDDNLETLCEKLNRIYHFSFIDLWNFYFDEKEEEISKKIYLKDEINKKNLEKYCGIRLEDIEVNNFDEIVYETKKELEKGNPIMIHMYRRLFPWDINYEKENVPDFFTHKAMVIGIDEDNFLFADGFCNKFNEYLSFDTCRKSVNNKLTKIAINEDFQADIKKFFYEFKENQKNNYYMFNNLAKFSELLNTIEKISELEGYNEDLYMYSRMYNSINKIIRSRKKVKALFKTLGNLLENEKLNNISNQFDRDILNWEYINFLFTKYTKSFDSKYLKKASKYIDEIKMIEIDLYNQLERVEI